MSRNGVLILLGVLVMLAPFSGFPITIRSTLAVILGACVLAIGLSLRMQQARNSRLPSEVSVPEPDSPTSEAPYKDS